MTVYSVCGGQSACSEAVIITGECAIRAQIRLTVIGPLLCGNLRSWIRGPLYFHNNSKLWRGTIGARLSLSLVTGGPGARGRLEPITCLRKKTDLIMTSFEDSHSSRYNQNLRRQQGKRGAPVCGNCVRLEADRLLLVSRFARPASFRSFGFS